MKCLFAIVLILTWGTIFFGKEVAAEQGGVDFEIKGWGICCTLVLEVEERFMQTLFGFLLFCWQKRIAFKSSLDLYFRALIIAFIWFA